MEKDISRPSVKELAELTAYLTGRERGLQPAPGEPGFPSGLAGELLLMAERAEPDPDFVARLERRLRQSVEARAQSSRPGWLSALWRTFTLPERKTTMKPLITFAIVAIVLLVILWVSLPSLLPSPAQTQIAVVTPPTSTPAPSPISPLTPTVVPPTSRPPVAINFTPRPIPSQVPTLPSLVSALGAGYGGSGAGNLPEGLPLSLDTELPAGPSEVNAYYRLENNPLTLEEANQIAARWGLDARLYIPQWMQDVSPDQIERSYYAIDGMQDLSMWNGELSYTNLAIFPIFGGHQYPQVGLLPSDQASATAIQYLTERGFLNFPYRIDLSNYDYGLVDFYRLLDDLEVDNYAASVKIDPQGQVGSAWVNREDYQAVGTYPVLSAGSAWEMLAAGQPDSQVSISYYPAQDANPKYWGRIYPSGQIGHLFGRPTVLRAAENSAEKYVQLNNLVLAGDLSSLTDYLLTNQGYIHAWGEVQDVNDTRQLQLAGWEPFDEFSGYFDGTVLRTADGDSLELSDGRQLRLPDLPADVPADIPLYAEGGLVGDTLEWFILQVHPFDEGTTPPDLSQAQAVIDHVELVYLATSLSYLPGDMALEPAYRMLVPAWKFTGSITNAGGADLIYQAYVGAASNP